MSASLVGLLQADAAPLPTLPPALTRTLFGGGALGSAPGYDLLTDGPLICAARGQAELPGIDAAGGQAAGWLAAWRRHAEGAADGARGRFAVAIIDTRAASVWLAVDRFATWPLCHAADAHHFAFSDRADAVPGEARALDPQAIFDYLFFHVIPAPRTVFDGVARLPAGHCAHWHDGRLNVRRWWMPRFEEPATDDFAARRAEFLGLVEQSVAHAAQGAECGAFLSGGTDSSTVSGMLCKVLGKPARTWSMGFDAEGYDEMAYARIAARHFGTEHHEYYVTPDDLLDGIPRVATHYDQPFGNSSAVPAWICARRAREAGVQRLLAGDGGDELFGGNTRYARQRIFGLYEHLPAALRGGVLEPLLGGPLGRLPLARKGASYVEQARVPLPDRLQRYNLLLRLGTREVFEADFLARVDTDAPFARQREVWAHSAGAAQINRLLAYDWVFTLADNDLPKVVGTTALAGLEVAFPLLSDDLVDFSLRLPPSWKLKGLNLRWFFKEALRGFLPDEILAKKKHGFGLPFGVWACRHDGLRRLAADALGTLAGRGIVRPAFIDELLARHLPAHPGYYGEMVWILTMLELWLRAHPGAALPGHPAP
ncbi:asparagine synthase [Pseudothauera nasutitermitis]|uniref:asparagine synthase (glutamine-hydrolyzing) n=1 Tax=Pseudothauera nasutitermitis TaxID=2565930 RepID=A0A4S4AWK7_9RHOO|nr:asparagine synthase C-terminal domain-containing protein [Pseudothauera nasutitermitis]THF63645.1 asparagine synthase [Pseudothauera nasutitermitis]